jgi:hypothetical protein
MRVSDCTKFITLLGSLLVSSALADPTGGNGTGPVSSNGPPGATSSGGSNLYYQPPVDRSAIPNDHGESLTRGAPHSGQLHEKVFEVDSLKKLPTGAVDSKFKGSLLDNSIDSIQSLNPTAKKDNQSADPNLQAIDSKAKLDAVIDKMKKNPIRAEPDSSPSPSPSATASPTAKPSGGSNK